MGDYNTLENNKEDVLDRILLFKPQHDMKYIRKLSMSYGYYTALAVVDNNDYVTHIGVENNFKIVFFKDLPDMDKKILGVKKCNNLKNNDLMSVYSINSALKLKTPYHLINPLRGMRFAREDEKYYLKKEIIASSHINPDTVNDSVDYNSLHQEDWVLDVDNIELDEALELELPYFNSTLAKGQTKLI